MWRTRLAKEERLPSERGFALVAAIMACLILLAVGMLVIYLSTGDLRVSTRVVGDKKALSAAESGIHRLMNTFDPENLSATTPNTQVDPSNDPNSLYSIGAAVAPTTGPATIPMAGFAIGGGQQWGQARFNVDVTGTNTTYNSTVTIGLGLGFGPVEISLMHR
jgi:Tfp pilus assembly protein PilX